MAKSKKRKAKRNWRQTLIVVLMIVAIASMIIPSILPPPGSRPAPKANRNPQPQAQQPETMPEPPFTKEGELTFLDGKTGEPIRKIDIEKAETDQERQQGLMYRRNMSDSQGMLFIMEESAPQSFWMRNTYIPLDIIFVDENNTILNIHQNARPRSEAPLPSQGNAKYVVEVIGGFTQAYGIKPGDKILWE
jgi:hypothetical protein